jgi:hypothetical protein
MVAQASLTRVSVWRMSYLKCTASDLRTDWLHGHSPDPEMLGDTGRFVLVPVKAATCQTHRHTHSHSSKHTQHM